MGTVYLIHLNTKLGNPDNVRGQAQHYIGYTTNLEQRIETHKSGDGAAMLRAANDQGIEYQVVRTWKGDQELERKLKGQKNAPRLCPVCRAVN